MLIFVSARLVDCLLATAHIIPLSLTAARGSFNSEQEAKQFFAPILNVSLELIHTYGVTDQDIINIIGTTDSLRVVEIA